MPLDVGIVSYDGARAVRNGDAIVVTDLDGQQLWTATDAGDPVAFKPDSTTVVVRNGDELREIGPNASPVVIALPPGAAALSVRNVDEWQVQSGAGS